MFDFEKLMVYSKAKQFNKSVSTLLKKIHVDKNIKDQLLRAAISIMLNIAEGSGRFTKPDKRNFYVIARGSCFGCVAIFNYLKDIHQMNPSDFDKYYSELEEISKMLFSLIKGFNI